MSHATAFLVLSAPVNRPHRVQPLQRAGQRGVALVVALLLLVVITLVGLAAVRGTIMQQKMSANMYDRQIAFQNAEAAMRAAAASIPTSPGDIARNCQSASVERCRSIASRCAAITSSTSAAARPTAACGSSTKRRPGVRSICATATRR